MLRSETWDMLETQISPGWKCFRLILDQTPFWHRWMNLKLRWTNTDASDIKCRRLGLLLLRNLYTCDQVSVIDLLQKQNKQNTTTNNNHQKLLEILWSLFKYVFMPYSAVPRSHSWLGSGVTFRGTLCIIGAIRDQSWVSYMQGKLPTLCTHN